MNENGGGLLTIGALARRTGVPVKTVRRWSDEGLLPPAARTPAGYRLYGPEAPARLEIVRTLRDLGVGVADIRAVLRSERTVADAAGCWADALDAQIRTLRLRRAVLRAVAARGTAAEELPDVHRLARLTAAERRRIIEEFIADALDGVAAPAYRAGLLARPRTCPRTPRPTSLPPGSTWPTTYSAPKYGPHCAAWPSTAPAPPPPNRPRRPPRTRRGSPG
ncbi:helix-turn-helix domain-containing protein [Streptomyces rimosus]|uniref:helix-turn-helix domain-containing protein n=1 Tax=Streptomyces rimosus TaxID=1927 RepID=UPI0037CE9083